MSFCSLIVKDVETGESMGYIELCAHHPMIVIEKNARNLSIGYLGNLHVWVLVGKSEISGMLVIEVGEISLIGEGDIACSLVSFVVEPGMRVAIEDGSDVYSVDMRRDRNLLQGHTDISCGTSQVGRPIIGACLGFGTRFIDNLGL